MLLLGYFKTTLEEFKVIYPERTSDYIKKDGFHSVPVIFLLVICKRNIHHHYFDFLFLDFPASILFLTYSYLLTNFSFVVLIKFVLILQNVTKIWELPSKTSM